MGLSGHPALPNDKFQVKVRDEEENPKSFSDPHTHKHRVNIQRLTDSGAGEMAP